MNHDGAAVVELLSSQRKQESAMSPSAPVQLRIAERPVRHRVERLIELALSLLRETETLARDNAFMESSSQLKNLDMSEGIDFYQEVERFEMGLIRLALDCSGGNQAQAARLLHMKPTTLNSRIKAAGIEY